MKNIYVGNLSFGTTEEDLRGLFEAYGHVDNAIIVKDKISGQSRGFGFVEMTDNEQGGRAITELNGKEISQRNLIVNEARSREPRPSRPGVFGGRRDDRSGRGPRY